ncbi:MAG: VanZ family protein [Verrucomicrobiales bacterium]|nr:VanZ family protein [Verrucomicrobiales bacterium]
MPPVFRRLPTRSSCWILVWFLWFTVLCVLSSMSHPGPHIDVVGIDKVEHTLYFCAGGLCLGLALALGWLRPAAPGPRTDFSLFRMALIVLPLGAAVGWLDEWHQSFTPGRSGLDIYDWCADICGTAISLLLLKPILRRLPATVQKA